MATKAEVLKVRVQRKAAERRRLQVAKAFRAWLMKGQLGPSQSTEMGRYTGARIL